MYVADDDVVSAAPRRDCAHVILADVRLDRAVCLPLLYTNDDLTLAHIVLALPRVLFALHFEETKAKIV